MSLPVFGLPAAAAAARARAPLFLVPRAAAAAVALLVPAVQKTPQAHCTSHFSKGHLQTALRAQTFSRSGVCLGPDPDLYRDRDHDRDRAPARDRGLCRGSSRGHGPYAGRGPASETYFCRDVASSLFSSLRL